jgi:hypothetical protein
LTKLSLADALTSTAEERFMARLTESISAINSAVRTLLAVVVVGAVGAGGWYGYSQYNANEIEAQRSAEALAAAQDELKQAQSRLQQANTDLQRANTEILKKEAVIQEKEEEIGELNETVEEQKHEIERLDTAMRLLKIDHRVARLAVLDQIQDPETKEVTTVVQFQELNGEGEPVEDPKLFRIKGDMVYIDSWIVKFDDKYVEQADIDRATSLVLFRRLFGEFQEPQDGFALDQVGARPRVYGRGGKISEFEKRIWDDFWTVANDDGMQDDLGIRAAHGDAPSIKVRKGKVYRVELRASDGLSITPAGDLPLEQKPAA